VWATEQPIGPMGCRLYSMCMYAPLAMVAPELWVKDVPCVLHVSALTFGTVVSVPSMQHLTAELILAVHAGH
jgi:hypothetical protein